MRRFRRPGIITLAIAAVGVLLAGCGEKATTDDEVSPEQADSGEAAPGTTPGAATALPGLPSPEEARTDLGALSIAEPGSMNGYSRDRFPHWSSEEGCTVRQIVLDRDGDEVTTDENCQPQSGNWVSVYDEAEFSAAEDLDIDHIVPLANAWRSGADSWDDEQRREFANDLEQPQLLSVSASSNRSKGDQSPDEWQPAESYWCEYSLAWTRVKSAYELTVTEDEHAQLTAMLDTCPAA